MKKKATKTEKQKDIVEMSLVNPHAAGIDIGDTEHVVAVPEGRDKGACKKVWYYDLQFRSYYPMAKNLSY